MPDALNKLYYGDNLQVLRDYIADQSVDLVYLDPPFNSRQEYAVLFKEKDGSSSAAQITAFKDTWEWNLESQAAYEEIVERGGRVADAMRAFKTLLGNTDMMAYLAMMAPRLVELSRVLKDTGSIYLHCDSTASHYLKLLMDGVFGAQLFVNEVIWKRYGAHNDVGQGSQHYGRTHDSLLFFSKTERRVWNQLFMPLGQDYVETSYRYRESDGRRFRVSPVTGPGGVQKGNPQYEWNGHTRAWRYSKETMQKLHDEGLLYYSKTGYVGKKLYLDASKGVPVQDIWSDIPSLSGAHAERLGYPTQKPEALLERILSASSNEGDVILDPFCGCGTTVQVAQKLNRRWIGIDITHLAISLIKTRLTDTFGEAVKATYSVIGEPTDLTGAEQLALENKYQFQYWALGKVDAQPTGGIKKGADRGIDGRKYFHDDRSGDSKQIIFSVKGGRNIGVSELRDLIGVLQREKAEIGVYISFEEPTKPMVREAAEAGFYNSPAGGQYPRVQLLTIKDLLLNKKQVEFPRLLDATFKKAPKYRPKPATNLSLNLSGSDEE